MEPEDSLPHSQQLSTYPYPEPKQSSPCPHPTSRRPILILSSHLILGLPSGLFPSGFPTKTLYTALLPHMCCMPCSSHSYRYDHPNIWWAVHIVKLILMKFSQLPCYFVPLSPNILLSTLFSNTLSLRSSFNVSDQVSHPYKTRGKNHISVLLNCWPPYHSELNRLRYSASVSKPQVKKKVKHSNQCGLMG